VERHQFYFRDHIAHIAHKMPSTTICGHFNHLQTHCPHCPQNDGRMATRPVFARTIDARMRPG